MVIIITRVTRNKSAGVRSVWELLTASEGSSLPKEDRNWNEAVQLHLCLSFADPLQKHPATGNRNYIFENLQNDWFVYVAVSMKHQLSKKKRFIWWYNFSLQYFELICLSIYLFPEKCPQNIVCLIKQTLRKNKFHIVQDNVVFFFLIYNLLFSFQAKITNFNKITNTS